jgi:hypothetical protein
MISFVLQFENETSLSHVAERARNVPHVWVMFQPSLLQVFLVHGHAHSILKEWKNEGWYTGRYIDCTRVSASPCKSSVVSFTTFCPSRHVDVSAN